MFSIKENECVGFESIWKVKKVYTVSNTQTAELSTQDEASNTPLLKSMETQTDEDVTPDSVCNMEKLSSWLHNIYPLVSKELNESVNSQAFKNFKFSKNSEQPVLKLVETFKVQEMGDGKICRVSGLSWNSTGNTLAVSCNEPHKAWCYHLGAVTLYTFNRYDKMSDTPVKRLRTETCVNVVRFHPVMPFVVAAGTQSGQVLIWNTQYEEGDNIICKINAHEELVTHMSWVHDIDVTKAFLLATSSLDGNLNLWTFDLPRKSLKIKHKYQIKSPILSRTKRISAEPEEISKKIVRGILTFDFSPYAPDVFIVGAQGGLVIQCSLLGTVALKGSSTDVPISDPVYKYFSSHEGEVNKVSFSPNRKEMFLTSSTDGEIRIYILEQDEPCKVILLNNPLSSVNWVPFQERIITACGYRGVIEVYSLLTDEEIETTVKDYVETATLTQMELNRARTSTIAVGTDKGSLQIWTAPWNLYNCTC